MTYPAAGNGGAFNSAVPAVFGNSDRGHSFHPLRHGSLWDFRGGLGDPGLESFPSGLCHFAALSHFERVRLLIEDYVHTPWLRVSLFGLSWAVGIVFFIMGFVTFVPFGS